MLYVLLAALLSGTAMSAIDTIFVALTSAPVWLGPKTFLITWCAYVIIMAAGLAALDLILNRMPFIRRHLQDQVKKFLLYCLVSLLAGSILLSVLVAKDVRIGMQFWTLLLVIGLIGMPMFLMLRLTVVRVQSILRRAVTTSVMLILMANGVWLAADQQYGAQIRERNSHFTGNIPNVLLLVMDTCRSDHFSCNGYSFRTTPNLDRIAAEGVNWPNAYSASNWTPPGHISIFTGKYPIQHGNCGKPYMPDDLLSLSEVLNQQGYNCVSIYENPLAGKSINLTQGIDYDLGVLHNTWIYPMPFRLWDKLKYNDDGAYVTFATARQATEWIKKKGGHIFLYVNIAEPHVPYRINQPYFAQFTKDLDMSRVGDLARIQDLCVTRDLIIQDSARFAGFTEESFAYLRAIYDSELAYDDEHFGRLADWMRSEGLLDNTLMVITADHGEVLGEHMTLGHEFTLFKPALHIPMILRYPALAKPARRDEYVSNVDVFPTILSLMDRKSLIPSDVMGVDMLHPPADRPRILLSSNLHRGGQYSLLENGLKLIVNREEDLRKFNLPDTVLYDLVNDWHETADLRAARPEESGSLLAQLNDWMDHLYVEAKDSIKVSSQAREGMAALGYVH